MKRIGISVGVLFFLILVTLVAYRFFGASRFFFKTTLYFQDLVDPEMERYVFLDKKINSGTTTHYGRKFDTYFVYGSVINKEKGPSENDVMLTVRLANGQTTRFLSRNVNIFFSNNDVVPDYISTRDPRGVVKLFKQGMILNVLWLKDVNDGSQIFDSSNRFSDWIKSNPPYSVLVLSKIGKNK